MSMEPVLLGVAAPAIASTANVVSRTSNLVAQSFGNAFQSAGHLLANEPSSEFSHTSESKSLSEDDSRFALLGELLAGSSPTNSSPQLTIENIQAHANDLQTDIQHRIQEALAGAGIKLDSPLRLAISDVDGTLEVDGAHPQRAVIEAALNADQSLAADFQKLLAEQNILDTYSRSKKFAREFASQPWQTIAAQVAKNNNRYAATLEVSKDSSQLQLQFD